MPVIRDETVAWWVGPHAASGIEMDDDVQPQVTHDQCDRTGDFAALFAQLERPDAVAPIESGLMRLLGTINATRRDPRSRH